MGNEASRGNKWTEKWETRLNLWQEMGEKWETRRNSRQEMGVIGKQDEKRYIIFQQKNEKKNRKNTEENAKKRKNTQEKTENYKKYRNMILTRFRDMLKTETRFRQDLEKCWKRKREQKKGLLECHETTIREQKRGLGAGLVPPSGHKRKDFFETWCAEVDNTYQCADSHDLVLNSPK